MSNNLLVKNGGDAISGFYYDQQLENRLLTMTLHPNMIYDEEYPPHYWKAVEGADVDSEDYRIEPIATAIVTEDFSTAISNEWADSTFADDITGLFNSFKPMAPLLDTIGGDLSDMSNSAQPYLDSLPDDPGTKTVKGINKGTNIIGNLMSTGAQYLNRALVIQGSRFSYYNGSSVGFGNMTMKYTIFSGWSKEGKWESCVDIISKELINYCIGKYVRWDSSDTDSELTKEQKTFMNEFVGWQLPPGGFKSDLQNIDKIQQGTLKLIIGGIYSISNLVIQDAQFTFSKQIVKRPLPENPVINSTFSIDLCPMYCDVQLTLKPAAKYTGVSLERAIKGEGVADIQTELKNNLNSRLQDIDSSLKKTD